MNIRDKEMQITEWLKDYNSYKAGILNLENLIRDIAEEDITVNYDKNVSGPTYKFNSAVENAILKIDKLNIEHRINVMKKILESIDRAMDSLCETEKEVLIKRCVKGMYYYQFCYDLGISERTAKRVKKEALNKMVIAVFGIE